MKRSVDVIRRPILSEKSSLETEKFNRVSFEVELHATKPQIRNAVEKFFNVKVLSLNTTVVPGKGYRTKAGEGKTASWKKAVITLRQGDKIEFFKGV